MAPPVDPPSDSRLDLSSLDDGLSASGFANKQISVKLDDDNFLLWRQQVKLLVRGFGLEHFLEEDTPVPAKLVTDSGGERVVNPAYIRFIKQNISLASWLLSTITLRLLSHFVGDESSATVWSAVCRRYSKLTTTRLMHLHFRLRSIKKGTLSMTEYTSQIKELCDLLANYRNLISKIEQVATVLNGLPSEFEPTVAVITASKDPYTFDAAVSLLVDAEVRVTDPLRLPIGINSTAYMPSADSVGEVSDGQRWSAPSSANRGDFRPPSGGRFRGRSKPQCQSCGKFGHLTDRCWFRFKPGGRGAGSSRPTDAQAHACCCHHDNFADSSYSPYVDSPPTDNSLESPQVNAVHVTSDSSSAVWLPDSGATHHVTSSPPAQLHSAHQYTGQSKVQLGDGPSLSISSVGQCHITSSFKPLVLDQLLVVPQITKNLLSVSKFATNNNVYFKFHSQSCYVKDESTWATLLEGSQVHGLYQFQLPVSLPVASASALTCAATSRQACSDYQL
ncbi:hypothetical protein HRI_002303800 [Hibiscus trionum]|uniref:CCHC-type domain-containing protein n=1 Tax=Hibiscus trionum TaxID=183268 RepID=A0A9W7M5D3_HIBTR|nr:hypothetical protein HRI_002303800 [Hibiscus trionum]